MPNRAARGIISLWVTFALAAGVSACGDSESATDATTGVDTPGTTDTATDVGANDVGANDVVADVQADTTVPPAVDLPWPGWDSATVYFVMTDRFFDGNPANNTAYGRQPDGADEIATFHGGDLAGLTQKLTAGYFRDLGVSAIWITAPYEQVHGWISGSGIKHYGYHGYFALDYTRVDAAMGTDAELETFVDTAHAQGIRVVFDVVMNHPGYATPADLDAFGVDVLAPGWEAATPSDLYDYIDFDDPDFNNWWGHNWIRAEIGDGYPAPGPAPLKNNLDFLPDFLTEATATDIGLPVFYANKDDTRAVERPGNTVRDYLVEWLTAWVRDYGIDGFRCDTAKHVEMASWSALAAAADTALAEWRAAHPSKAFPDSDYRDTSKPHWMTAEVFPHGVAKDAYFSNGFDSVINFDFKAAAAAALANLTSIDAVYAEYATKLNGDPDFNVLSYLSSHDTSLFFEANAGKDLAKQRLAGTLLLLAPGAVQIFYGDENARTYGSTSSDASHKTRTDYAWGANPDVLAHWQTVGRFRKAHPAIGAGSHTKLSDAPYVFKRALGTDVVFVALGATGPVTISVSPDIADGATLRDAYSGATATVSGGTVMFTPGPDGVVLIEEAP